MEVIVHPAIRLQAEAMMTRPGATLLIHGPEQVGKQTVALEMARRINCLGCKDGSCRSCRMVRGANHPDILLLELDDKGKIGVDAVHELQHSLRYQQYNRQGKRVAVISHAETLTLPAQNALLKTLEEPPFGTTIIMTSTNPASLLPTVLSRCSQLYLPPVHLEQVEVFLRRHHPELGSDAGVIAERSRGRIGRAVQYAHDDSLLVKDAAMSDDVSQFLGQSNLLGRLQLAAQLAAAAERRAAYCQELIVQIRALVRQDTQKASYLGAVERFGQRLQANVNPKAAFEALAVELG